VQQAARRSFWSGPHVYSDVEIFTLLILR